jgi:hypothetical protein
LTSSSSVRRISPQTVTSASLTIPPIRICPWRVSHNNQELYQTQPP